MQHLILGFLLCHLADDGALLLLLLTKKSLMSMHLKAVNNLAIRGTKGSIEISNNLMTDCESEPFNVAIYPTRVFAGETASVNAA